MNYGSPCNVVLPKISALDLSSRIFDKGQGQSQDYFPGGGEVEGRGRRKDVKVFLVGYYKPSNNHPPFPCSRPEMPGL